MRIVDRTKHKALIHEFVQGIAILEIRWVTAAVLVNSPDFLSITLRTNCTGYDSNMYPLVAFRLLVDEPYNGTLKGW